MTEIEELQASEAVVKDLAALRDHLRAKQMSWQIEPAEASAFREIERLIGRPPEP